MDETDDLGRYIQGRLRAKNIEDKEVATLLNISVKTVPKIYPSKDIYSDRLAKLSILLNEDLFLDFYGKKEPLKTLLNKEKTQLLDELAKANSDNEQQKKLIELLSNQLLDQNSTIKSLHEQIIANTDEILNLLRAKS
jgi:hypothetical protein